MPTFQTTAQFKTRAKPPSLVDELESTLPGWIQQNLDDWGSYIYSRLRKRYAIAFDMTNPPLAILRWQAALTLLDCYLCRGFNPSSEQDVTIKEQAATALAEIKEAADSKDGLFDLPLIEGTVATAITQAAPLGQAQVTAYDWVDVEADALDSGVTQTGDQ